jgi:hypothetical protein
LDSSFDTDGKVTLGIDATNENKDEIGLGLQLQTLQNGANLITVVSTRFKENLLSHVQLADDGSKASSGTGSFNAVGPTSEEVNAVLFTSNQQKYYVVGSGTLVGTRKVVFVTRFVFANNTLSTDPAFGIDGTQIFALPDASLNPRVAILQNDQILVGGFLERDDGTRDALLLRFLR